ncbi:MAG: hypothetical protein E6Q97_36255 [Desulfurellales bacterium]|nr:MAG: hypothetical protein E6Q97_36255 [Desulfurellales bacterium]
MTSPRELLYALATICLSTIAIVGVIYADPKTVAGALATLAALYIRPPKQEQGGVVPMTLLVVLALTGCKVTAEYGATGFRSSSVEMTPQASNPIPSGVGGIYTKNTDNLPRFVDTSGNEYRAGDAKHIAISAGVPGSAVLGDCWTDSTNGNRLTCKEDAGDLVQRFEPTDPGPIGCGGTPSTGCFTSVTIDGAPAEAFFSRTCTLTSAAAATPVNCLTDADVPATKRAYLMGWHAKVNGATPWATTANCWIQDTGGTSNIFVTMAVAALTANAFVSDLSANVTQQSPYSLNQGGTLGLGLEVACNANGTGSNLVVTVFGVSK